ncbi:Arylsulfatase [Planctomycetales bacterium 10988]|nr:Arylsulfatase [Planctomycetales bacterium 10988]
MRYLLSLIIFCSINTFLWAERPNIVVILADDLGFSDVGCYGSEIPTPNIDGLAENGLLFKQFYNTSRCCPTRASLLTGLYPHEAGVGHMVYSNHGEGYLGYLNQQCVTLAEVLGSAGYQTLMAGKWHVGHAKGQWPSDRGFQRFYGIHIHVDSYFKVLTDCPVFHDDQLVIPPTENPPNTLNPNEEWYTTDVFTDWALKFMKEADSDKPFFLYLAHNAPHWPIEAPEENIENFKGKYLKGWDFLRKERLKKLIQLGIVPADTQLPPSDNLAWKPLPKGVKKELDFRRAIYAAQVERLDQNIGRVVSYLKKSGKLENTLILFLSDNGCSNERGMFGYKWKENRMANYQNWRKESGRSASQGQAWACASNTPFRLYKRWVHEGGIATPLIAHWPKMISQPGAKTDQVGHVVDLMATCCDLAEVTYPASFQERSLRPLQGKSLVPAFQNPQSSEPRTLYWEHEKHAAIRQGDWKLVTKDASDPAAWELYDLSKDRVELNNLAKDYPEKVEQLSQKWHAWAEKANALPFPDQR